MAERSRKQKSRPRKNGRAKGEIRDGPPPGVVGIGDNVPDEVYERAIERITKTSAALETAKAKHRQAYSEAKDDGCNIDSLKLALKLHNKRDHGTVLIDYTTAGRILKIMDSPLATQLSLFQDLANKPSPYAEGEQAGKAAVDAGDNPHKPGSAAFLAWTEGWEHGQQHNREKIGKSDAAVH